MIIEKTPLQLRNLKPISFCFKIDLKNKKKNSFLKLNYFQTHWKKKNKVKIILHRMTRPFPILRGVQIYSGPLYFRHALESGLFPLS